MTTETFITEELAVAIERTGRGTYATVKDAHSPFNGVSFFGSTPDMALGCLLMKVEEMKQETVR